MRCSKERRFNHFLGAAEQREWESDARAIAFAMSLMQKADRITVLTVIGGTEVSGPSAEQLVRNLRRNWSVARRAAVSFSAASRR